MPPFNTASFETFASALTSAMSAAVSPIEVTITQLVPAVGHALAELRVKQEETSAMVKAAVTEARIEREESRAFLSDMFRLVVSALQQNNNSAEQQRSNTRRALATSAQALLEAEEVVGSFGPSSHADAALLQLQQHLDSVQPSRPPFTLLSSSVPTVPIITAVSARPVPAFPTSSVSQAPGPAFPPLPPSQTPSQASSSSLAPPSATPTPLSLLQLSKRVGSVRQLVQVWYVGDGLLRSLKDRLEGKDAGLDVGAVAARKLLSRWRRVVELVEDLSSGTDRDKVAVVVDRKLKSSGKMGLRALSDNVLAKKDVRATFVANIKLDLELDSPSSAFSATQTVP
ncbi:hypothetical protein CF319_g6665 [Tilletia indica]|nr:hypothetical protein CF319_g6665 [Tilletia indica]